MKVKISLSQFNILIFISSLIYIPMLTSNAVRDNFSDSLISLIISQIFGAILCLPIFIISNKSQEFKVSKLYLAYFLASDIILLSQMQNMFTNTIYPNVSPIILGLFLLIVSSYGAYKGIETVARSSLLVLLALLLGVIIVIIGILPLISMENIEVIGINGCRDIFRNSYEIFARSSFLPQICLMLTFLNQKLSKSFFTWQGLQLSFALIIFLSVIFCLGNFAQTQMYPVYTLSSVASLGPVQRMDTIFTFIWLNCLAIRTSIDLILMGECVTKKYKNITIYVSALIILLSSYLIVEFQAMELIAIATAVIPVLIIILGLVLPLIQIAKGERS